MAHPFAACQSGQLTAARLRRTFTVLPFRAENKLSYNIALLPIFFKKFCGVQKRFSKPDHGTDVIVTIFSCLPMPPSSLPLQPALHTATASIPEQFQDNPLAYAFP